MCLYLTEYFFVVAGVFRAYFYGKITFKRKKCEAGRPISIRTCIYPLIQVERYLHDYKNIFSWNTSINSALPKVDYVSQMGGILGLFTGFSFISGLELIYWLTIRLTRNMDMTKSLKKQTASRMSTSQRDWTRGQSLRPWWIRSLYYCSVRPKK